MNIENLKLLREAVANWDESKFDMGDYYNDDNDTYCISGILYQVFNKDENKIPLSGFDDIYQCNPFRQEFLGDMTINEITFLFAFGWSRVAKLNTIECALFRLDKLIEGYKPDEITIELHNLAKII